MVYGLETWMQQKMDKNSIGVFKRKVHRVIYDLCRDVNIGESEKIRNL